MEIYCVYEPSPISFKKSEEILLPYTGEDT